jgi:hypothetical protein
VHVLVFLDLEQQVEILGEQRVVVLEPEPEQRERFREGAAPDDDLRSPVGDQVERGELLEDAHRVGGAQHRDRARESDAFRARRRGREDHRGGRVEEVGAVMLADAEHVEADGVRVRDPIDEESQRLRRGDLPSVAVFLQDASEAVDADLHGVPVPCHVAARTSALIRTNFPSR